MMPTSFMVHLKIRGRGNMGKKPEGPDFTICTSPNALSATSVLSASSVSASLRLPLLHFLIPEHPAEHLAHQALGKLVAELDLLRHFELRKPFPAVPDQFL